MQTCVNYAQEIKLKFRISIKYHLHNFNVVCDVTVNISGRGSASSLYCCLDSVINAATKQIYFYECLGVFILTYAL